MGADPSDVINWEEAMQQVGDDEEFLRELLADLRAETEAQLVVIAGIIQVSVKSCSDERMLSHFIVSSFRGVLRYIFSNGSHLHN